MEQRQSFEEEFSRTGGKLSLMKGLTTNGGASLFGCLSPPFVGIQSTGLAG